MITPLGPIISSLLAQPIDTMSPSSGRVLYPSSTYQNGNPGHYYDPLQFPVSTETQTSPTYLSPPRSSNDPLHPVSHFMDLPTNIGPPLHQGPLSLPQADLLSLLNEDHTTQHNNYSPCLDNNSEERSHHYTSIHDICCQSSFLLQNMQ